jgi:3-hydroxyacyl-CoA dehydrogenase
MFRKVGVVGAGRMGISLAHLNTGLGLDTVVVGRPDPGRLARARDTLVESHAREVRRGRQTADAADAAMARVHFSGDFGALADCDVVIEAVYEELETKRQVLAAAEARMGPECVYLSATSSIPAGMLGAQARRPGRVIVAHYIWPAHRRRLVEMAVPDGVEPQALERAMALMARQGKRPLLVRDTPGFFVSRVLAAYWSECFYLVQDGAPPEQIDRVLEAFGWPMGPCRMMDTVGMGNLATGYRFLLPFLTERMAGLQIVFAVAEAGLLGYHARRGFYLHERDGWVPNPAMFELLRVCDRPAPSDEAIVERSTAMILNECAYCIADGVAADWKLAGELIDGAFDFPHGGVLSYLGRVGIQGLRADLARLERALGPRFRAPDLADLPLDR